MKKISKKYLSLTAVAAFSLISSINVSARTKQPLSVSVDNDEILTLTVSETDIDFDTTTNTDLIKETFSVTGSTNASHGYNISLQTSTGYSQLKHNLGSVTSNIPSISESVSDTAFPTLGWGYSLDGTTFNSIPTKASNIFSTSTVGTVSHDFTTGVRVAEALVSGSYSNTLMFTIISNEIPSGLKTITYLQQMTPKICELTPAGTALPLIDIRDGKKYTVKKFSDGNCWMYESLALDLSTSKTLTPDDTDVRSNWTPSFSTVSYGVDDYPESYVAEEEKDFPYSQHQKTYSYYEESDIDIYSYTWAAAIASNDSSIYTEELYDAPDSICPKGWELPKGFSTTDYTTSFHRYEDTFDNVQVLGNRYWTATNYYDDRAVGLGIYGTPYIHNDGIWRGTFASVHCVAKNPNNYPFWHSY